MDAIPRTIIAARSPRALRAVPAAARPRRSPAAGVRARSAPRFPARFGARPRRSTRWAATLEPWRPVVVVLRARPRGQPERRARAARARLRRALARRRPRALARGGRRDASRAQPPTHWVTRERPKIDRIACPWLVRRFIDPSAEFFYVPNAEVRAFAAANGATPYDVPDVEYTHRGGECSFDAFIRRHGLRDPALDAPRDDRARRRHRRARPRRAGAGLLAVSLGLSRDVRRRPRDAEAAACSSTTRSTRGAATPCECRRRDRRPHRARSPAQPSALRARRRARRRSATG